MCKRNLMTLVGLLAVAFLVIPEEAWGRSRGGSSSRSSSSRSSRGFSSGGSRSSKGTSWGSRSSTSTSRMTSVTKPKTATDTDKKAYESSAKSNPFNKKSFANQNEAKSAAEADFKQRYQARYPSKYETEPTTRPEHIPAKIELSGQTTEVSWRKPSDGPGGYYYRDPGLDRWIMYDMMSYPPERNRYMYRYGYDPSGRVYVQRGWSTERILLWLGGGVLIGLVGFVLLRQFFWK